MYAFFVICGQSASTLLGRLYYDKGGKSIWLAMVSQLAGFPILVPCYCLTAPPKTKDGQIQQPLSPSAAILVLVYFSFGICLAAYTLMYAIGLLHLQVSTFSLVCASQLAFNALFSFFLHSQKFTPFILNSLVLLTISSTLLISQTNPPTRHGGVLKGKYMVGFLCTIGASAVYGLMLSLTQLSFKKILKGAHVLEIVMYQSLVATFVSVVGLFTSGEWRGLLMEMAEFELGKFSYVMTLIETAIASQFFIVGTTGLILEVSSLFSNAISVLGLPVIPILAVLFFQDKMDAVKVIAMVLAIWGFVSYVYQCYLDNNDSKSQYLCGSEVSKSPLLEETS
ncbi:putative purine permease 9 [Hibiscus syriacus]|uniref:Probable purine permease n=2 Tax=Hibiscus syriacus TaxID=106335 RepID=A0A6A3AV25_HIBSY|nr:putative purine permease 9 [Hibiscus syriacus]